MKLSQAVNLAASVVGGHQAPYLPHVGLVNDGVSLTVSGVAPALRIACDVDPIEGHTGAVWCDAKGLAEVLARHKDSTIKAKAGALEVSSGKARAKVPTHATGLRFGETGTGETFEIDGGAMTVAIGRVIDAAATDADRGHVAGVFFDGDCVVATDSHRIHVSPLKCPKMKSIVPTHVAQAMLRAIESMGGGIVKLVLSPSEIQMIGGDVRIAGPLPSREFIPWRPICDLVKRDSEATVNAKALIEAIKDARLGARFTATDKAKGEPPVRIEMRGGSLLVTSSVDDATSSECDASGEMVAINVDPSQVTQALASIGAEEVTIWSSTATNPIEIAAGNERRIIMPKVA